MTLCDERTSRPVPFGWIYQVDGDFAPGEHIPPSAIVGAWEADGRGNPAGAFMRNPAHGARQAEQAGADAAPSDDHDAGTVTDGSV